MTVHTIGNLDVLHCLALPIVLVDRGRLVPAVIDQIIGGLDGDAAAVGVRASAGVCTGGGDSRPVNHFILPDVLMGVIHHLVGCCVKEKCIAGLRVIIGK